MDEVKKIGWVVAPSGEVTKWEPPKQPVLPKTRSERHAQYRLGMKLVLDLLTKAGFECNAIEQSNVAISVERGKLMFDVSIREPANIAFVTSHPLYDPEKGNARVVTAKDIMGCDYVAQVIGSKQGGNSTTPVYVPLPKNVANPAEYFAVNVVRVMQSMVSSSPELRGIDLSHLENQSHLSLDAGSPGV